MHLISVDYLLTSKEGIELLCTSCRLRKSEIDSLISKGGIVKKLDGHVWREEEKAGSGGKRRRREKAVGGRGEGVKVYGFG